MNLQALGWDGYWQAQWEQHQQMDALPARIVAQHRGLCRIAGEFGELWAETAGRMFYDAGEVAGIMPVAGDWIAASIRQDENRGTIHAILPRRTSFSRKAAGKRTEAQVLAANVDTVFLMASLNRDLNARRIERYLTLAWESGAMPVLVLSKSDLCTEVAELTREVAALAAAVPVHAVSAFSGDGLEVLAPYFADGKTVALLGSSGAGKSTLVNRLVGRDVQAVREIREGDDRGRHTTTARELFVLPQGGLILDTPGLRELQLWDAGDGLGETFAEIEALALHCRFRDCTHEAEPGCAVRAAIASGALDGQRLASMRKLEAEQQFQLRKADVNTRLAEQKRWKKIHAEQRAMYDQRRREGRDK